MKSVKTQLIFKKVAVSERKNIFREIASDRAQIAVRGMEDMIFHLMAMQNEKDEVLFCHLTQDSKSVTTSQKVVVNFTLGNERYFMQTELYFEANWAMVRIDHDLFQLQRRANARFELPADYGAVFIMTLHEGTSYFVDCALEDISAGGFRISVPDPHQNFRAGEVLRGSLRLGGRRPMDFDVEVRFARRTEKNGKSFQQVGVQFLNVDNLMENRLLSLMMDLQREIFLKFPTKK